MMTMCCTAAEIVGAGAGADAARGELPPPLQATSPVNPSNPKINAARTVSP